METDSDKDKRTDLLWIGMKDQDMTNDKILDDRKGTIDIKNFSLESVG